MHSLRDMTSAEVAVAVPRIFDGYVEDRVEAGQDPDEARAQAESQHATLFPGGVPAEGQHLMHVLDDGDVVGLLWMGRPLASSAATWFVYFVQIDEAHRGRGLGRVAMECAEQWAREHGGSRIAPQRLRSQRDRPTTLRLPGLPGHGDHDVQGPRGLVARTLLLAPGGPTLAVASHHEAHRQHGQHDHRHDEENEDREERGVDAQEHDGQLTRVTRRRHTGP